MIIKNYKNELFDALSSFPSAKVDLLVQKIESVIDSGGTLFFCGNGGSAAMADHFVCDFLKGIREKASKNVKAISLSCNGPLITALANDTGFDNVFSSQINSLAGPGDLLIAISSSGKSPNIIKAIVAAHDCGADTFALVGFDGGESKKIADNCIHVMSHKYQIVEDSHSAILHAIALELMYS